ncbi:MAG TPA: hypothetical protein VF204_18540 [Streptosporangiaceae bacterium]
MDRRTLPLQDVHPAVAGTDIAAGIAACVLFWRRKPAAGLLIRLVPPVIATALLTRPPAPAGEAGEAGEAGTQPDPDGAGPAPGGPPPRPPVNQGIRAAGDALILWGAWRRRPLTVLAGAAVVALGWSVRVGPPANAP